MSKIFEVRTTMIYGTSYFIDANNEEDAMEKVRNRLDKGEEDIPNSIQVGGVDFDFGEITVDYADEITDNQYEKV